MILKGNFIINITQWAFYRFQFLNVMHSGLVGLKWTIAKVYFEKILWKLNLSVSTNNYLSFRLSWHRCDRKPSLGLWKEHSPHHLGDKSFCHALICLQPQKSILGSPEMLRVTKGSGPTLNIQRVIHKELPDSICMQYIWSTLPEDKENSGVYYRNLMVSGIWP